MGEIRLRHLRPTAGPIPHKVLDRRDERNSRLYDATLSRDQNHRPEAYSEEYVMFRLEEAGATLLSLPGSGPGNALKTSKWPTVHSTIEAYGWTGARLRPAMPEPARITRMDEALGWIEAIPQENYVLRRIVGARSLVSPLTGRYLFSWRRIGKILGADPRAVRRWHGKGIELIRRWLVARGRVLVS